MAHLLSTRPIPKWGFAHPCGRGGIGRRAALRSLWRKLRGSSSLLDRTSRHPRLNTRSRRAARAGALDLFDPLAALGDLALDRVDPVLILVCRSLGQLGP